MSLVQLHVYDVTAAHSAAIRNFNSFGREVGVGGIFHGGIEINQQEWSYGYAPNGSGVYHCTPRQNPMYKYRETVTLGITPLGLTEVRDVLAQLRKQWLGPDYDLLTNNCLHFCDSLAEGLQVPKIPAWLNRMAYGADAVVNFANQAVEQVRWLGGVAQSWVSSYVGTGTPDSGHLASAQSAGASSGRRPSPLVHMSPKLDALPIRHSGPH